MFARDQAPPGDVVRHLENAIALRTKVELTPVDTVQPNPPVMALMIEALGDRYLVVSPPKPEWMRFMIKGAPFALAFFDEESRLRGETTCLGRAKFQDEQGRMIFTFKFALPEALRREESNRRENRRIQLITEPEVELSVFELAAPIYGEAVDLGPRGARLRCHNAANKLSVGQDVYLKMPLPEPVGTFTDMVRITNLQPCKRHLGLMVGVEFQKPLEHFDELLDSGALHHRPREAG